MATPPPPPDFNWGTFWSAFSAIATMSAALVALFGQSFRDKFWPPKLELRLRDSKGEKTTARLVWVQASQPEIREADARYYFVSASNPRRWSPATLTQVMLLSLAKRNMTGGYDLQWSGEVPLEWRHSEVYGTERTIGGTADANLCSVVRDKWLGLHTVVKPNNLQHEYRTAVALRLTLMAKSAQTDSEPLTLDIAWDGDWHDGEAEMQQHLKISVFKPPVDWNGAP